MPGNPIVERGPAIALLALFALAPAVPAHAADGPILITQAKTLAGNVTPGDAPGFPVKLMQPGSYILGSNLQPPAGKAGIVIASNDVTIDLSGFRLRGVGGATTGISGGSFESVTIRNGTIAGFAVDGIHGEGNFWIISDMRVVANGESGIFCAQSCLVQDSIVANNLSAGIVMDDGIAIGNVLSRNGAEGLGSNNGAGSAQNAFILNHNGAVNGHMAGNAGNADPNVCGFTSGVAPC
jgi:hypothetical protein